MTKYVLHGGFTRENNEWNRTFYEEMARDVPDGGTVLLVYFASPEDDNSGRAKEDSAAFEAQSHGKKFNFLVATEKDFLVQIKRANAVYFRGGSTEKLIKTLQAYPNLKSLLKDKTVAGSSAGAYMLSTYYASHSGTESREGLHILPLRLICHSESTELPPTSASVSALMARAQDLELVVLKDFEWKVFND
jgi:peptidase E